MKKTKITAVAVCMAMAVSMMAGCGEAASKETSEETEETTVETTEEVSEETAETEPTTETPINPMITEYMRQQPNPSPYEPENPQSIDDIQDEAVRNLARAYEEDGYQFIATAEDFWYNGAGYAWYITDRRDPWFLVRGFFSQKEEGTSLVNVFCVMASEDLCVKYLDLSIQSVDGDIVNYSRNGYDEEDEKITFDRTTGVLTFINTVEHVDQGVG